MSSLAFDPIGLAGENWRAQGWEKAAPGMEVVTSVVRVNQILQAQADALLKPLGVTFPRFELLMLLYFSRTGSLPMKTIGRRLQVHPTSVTSAVDRLERDELVARVASSADRRTVLVQISPAGRDLAQRGAVALNEGLFADVHLSESEQETLIAVLTKFRRRNGDFAG